MNEQPDIANPDVKTLLARVYTHISLGQYEMVRESCQQLLLAYPANAQACAILGDLATQEGNLPDALHWYKQAVQREPANEEFRRKYDGAIEKTCFNHSEAAPSIAIITPQRQPPARKAKQPKSTPWRSVITPLLAIVVILVLGQLLAIAARKLSISDGKTGIPISGEAPSLAVNTDNAPIEKRNFIDKAAIVWVPGGTFTMGSPDGVGDTDELPAHRVTLTGYWIYKYEVTVAQYRTFCTATHRNLPPFPTGYSWQGKRGWDDPALQQHPIVNVSWYDAQAYAAWASASLPTEAQWEYVARGMQGRNYPWGGIETADDKYNGWDKTKCANYFNSYNVGKSTWPVGSFPAGASWCGAQDMAGNVWEWCADWFGDYSATAATNPSGPATGTLRVLRGASWYDGTPVFFRAADRFRGAPAGRARDFGFRCVLRSPGP